jgi:putative endonuclease
VARATATTDRRRALGEFGERVAERWYVERGAEVLDRNWRVREGEIDLVIRRSNALVFVEVKTRRSTRFGLPIEAITPAKAARLRRLVGLWIAAHPSVRYRSVRIDIASVLVERDAAPRVDVVALDV